MTTIETTERLLTSEEQLALEQLPEAERRFLSDHPVVAQKIASILTMGDDERDRLVAQELEAERDRNLEAMRVDIQRRLALVPPEYANATFTNQAIANWTDGFLDGKRTSLFVRGPVGRGKSHNAWAAYRRVVLAGYERGVEFRRVTRLLDELRPDKDKPGDSSQVVLERMTRVGLLILDDLGAENQTPWTSASLYDLIDERCVWHRPVIFTTNFTADDFRSWAGDRIASRVNGMCGEAVTLRGPDYRMPQTNESRPA